jgi:hypothetical protein
MNFLIKALSTNSVVAATVPAALNPAGRVRSDTIAFVHKR